MRTQLVSLTLRGLKSGLQVSERLELLHFVDREPNRGRWLDTNRVVVAELLA